MFSASPTNTNKIAQRRGATTVEFALTLPLVILFFFAAIEFARGTILRHAIDNAAYEACRVVIVPGAAKSEAVAAAQKILNTFNIKSSTITVSPNSINANTAQVTVTVSAPVSGNMWGVPKFLGAKSLTSQSTLITERTPGVQSTAMP